jgi:hypothetical protein
VRTSPTLTRVRLLAIVAAAAAVALAAATPAAAAHANGGQQPPPLLKQSVVASPPTSPATAYIARKAAPGGPAAESGCTWVPVPYSGGGYYPVYRSSYRPTTLIETSADNIEQITCGNTMASLDEADDVVTPHTGTHPIGGNSCEVCSTLAVTGTYNCTSGLACAGKWTVTRSFVLITTEGYVWGSWPPYCAASVGDTVLTCSLSTSPVTVAPYLPCTPVPYADITLSTGGTKAKPTHSASGHAGWSQGNCGVTTANVTAQLQEFFSNGDWYNIGPSKSRVQPPNKHPGWANPRAACPSWDVVSWRTVVGVSTIGQAGTDSTISPVSNIACAVPLPGAAGSPAEAP